MAASAGGEPGWLTAWRGGRLTAAAALARFDGLAGIEPEAMLGRWRGAGLATGHPLDGILEGLGWYGKAFEDPERVHPLLFDAGGGRLVAVEPALVPARAVLRWPILAPRGGVARATFRALRPLLAARRPGARLARLEFRGRASAAMVYARQPITDHFRAVDAGRVLGLMEMAGMARPFFFVLERDAAAVAGAGGAGAGGGR